MGTSDEANNDLGAALGGSNKARCIEMSGRHSNESEREHERRRLQRHFIQHSKHDPVTRTDTCFKPNQYNSLPPFQHYSLSRMCQPMAWW